ncbi:hypothetical protein CHU98_g5405 [Xylaria longipes]|nr:hypothetical protein CHU98_g5405 [Xylaria longipes]
MPVLMETANASSSSEPSPSSEWMAWLRASVNGGRKNRPGYQVLDGEDGKEGLSWAENERRVVGWENEGEEGEGRVKGPAGDAMQQQAAPTIHIHPTPPLPPLPPPKPYRCTLSGSPSGPLFPSGWAGGPGQPEPGSCRYRQPALADKEDTVVDGEMRRYGWTSSWLGADRVDRARLVVARRVLSYTCYVMIVLLPAGVGERGASTSPS